MTPFSLVAWCIIAVLVTVAVPYFIGKRALRKKKVVDRVRSKALWERLPIDEAAREVAKEDAGEYKNPYWTEKKYHFDKHGHKIDTATGEYVAPDNLSAASLADKDERRTAQLAKEDEAARSVGKSLLLASPYGARQRKPSVFLTPRQLERVNMARTAAGKRPLNRSGFTSAVSHAWDQPRRQPDTREDWLTYLIMYECLFAGHTSGRTTVDTGLTITPDAPYNGHGGEFAGAGASGDWTSPDASTATAAAAIASGGAILSQPDPYAGAAAGLYGATDPLSDPNSFKGSSDDAPAQNVQDPGNGPGVDNTAQDSAGTDALTSVSDSGSSSSSDSSSSSSSDSSSSSSDGGGGD